MDSGKKPEKPNPRNGANPLSQLLFLWIIPLFWYGAHKGLTADDLTTCLPKDRSSLLGNRLEDEWNKEIQKSQKRSRKPRLRNAMFRLFAPYVILDGFLSFLFVLVRSILPFVLAQLLTQFQRSTQFPAVSNTSIITTTTIQPFLNDNNFNLTHHRSIRSYEDFLHENTDERSKLNFFAPDNSIDKIGDIDTNNKNEQKQLIKDGTMELDDVRNKSIRDLITEPSRRPDKEDELMLNLKREHVEKFFQRIWTDVNWLACMLIVLTMCGCLLIHHYDLRQRLVGAQMRIACCSMIYRKSMRLSALSAGRTGSGYLINLMSNDVSRLDMGFIFCHYVWILPFQCVLISYLISQKIGWAAIVGVVGLLIKTIPVQTGLSRLSAKLRLQVALRTDARVGIMNEIIQGIQVIKMYAWEIPFQTVVAEARRMEVKKIRLVSYLRGVNLSTMVIIERSTLFITIATCVALGEEISADIVFAMAQYFNILQLTAAIYYPLALSLGAEALVSIKRIEDFLLLEEKTEEILGLERKNSLVLMDKKQDVLEVKNVSAIWDEHSSRLTLEDINFHVKQGQLCAIIGPVGSGKSSLMQLLLGELPIKTGTVTLHGSVSFACQKPWLFTGTVRNNILFGQIYDRKRYKEVVKCCALQKDFEQLPMGDRTVVGERGASLSGGQRARISLARAVYKTASIYLFDDPLSAVDAHVGKHLFEEVIGPKGRLGYSATRILITHQVHFLKEADVIIIIEHGRITHKGTYNQLSRSDVDFAKLLERTDEDADEHAKELLLADEPYEPDDIIFPDGAKLVKGYKPLKTRTESISKSMSSQVSMDVPAQPLDPEELIEDSLPIRACKRYLRAGSNIFGLVCVLCMLILSQIVISGNDYFVNWWTQQEHRRFRGEKVPFTKSEFLIMYGVLIIGVIIVCCMRCYLFFKVCMHASKVLHDKMFSSILHSAMRFFDTNPSGRILNRFSKDMGAIDELLPRGMMEALQILLVMSGILTMVLIVNPSMVVALLGAIFFFYLLIRIYIRPAQDLKRLEGIVRSPVFSHLTASISGLTTIRARNIQQELCEEFDGLQDVHSAVWQLSMSSNTAFGLWLDVVSTAFITCVTFSFIVFHSDTFSGNVGLAISQSLILTGMVQFGVRQTTEAMQQMTSVERVLQYTDLEPEKSPPTQPPQGWPQKGRIKFENMSLRYDLRGLPVLRNLNIDIQPGWKVGVVGRTGAGKSSLIAALFRLSHIDGGIKIDDIETSSISLKSLRSNISIIPQDPVLFSATIRYNLDPFGLYSDDALWRSLEDVELKQSVENLDFHVSEGGANFSVGERQLVCLARAILRNNKIMVLDEATANVDPQTDALIQRTIREKFAHCTVLTVAHRLHTVMDSDRMLVMEAGFAREFDYPHKLLQLENGLLRDMVDATGPKESAQLKRMAEAKYNELTAETVQSPTTKEE